MSGSHTYAQQGSFTITVTLHHDVAPDATAVSSASVADTPLVVTGKNITATQGLSTGAVVVATFLDPGGPQGISAYSASISWGDGSPAVSGTIAYDATDHLFTVSGVHTYSNRGNFTGQVTITHGTSAGVSATFSAAVSAASGIILSGINVSATAGAPFNGEVASFTGATSSAKASSFQAEINWGDGTPASGLASSPCAEKEFRVSGNHAAFCRPRQI